MTIIIDLVGGDDTLVSTEITGQEAKRDDDEKLLKEAQYEWLRRQPQPQVVPVEA